MIFIIINNKIDEKKARECQIYDNDGLNFYVDEYEISGHSIELSGWCFRQGTDTASNGATSIPIQVILVNKKDVDDKVFLNTTISCREDINIIYNDGGNYRYGGFSASKSTLSLDFDDNDYDILVYYPYWSQYGGGGLFGYRTGYSVVKGKLVQ